MTFGLVSGYCCGLRGEEARQENRIICVCWRGETSSGIQARIWADRLAAVNKQRSREQGPLFRKKKQHRAKIGDFENQVLERMIWLEEVVYGEKYEALFLEWKTSTTRKSS
jgi:hypothetical protein